MENITVLIQQLLALSQSPNEHEAAAAMAKAQELLTKYNLDMATVKSNESIEDSQMINEEVEFDSASRWPAYLLNMIAQENYCRTIHTPSGRRILGRRANVQAVAIMHNWIEPQVYRLATKSGYKRADKNTYIFGIIDTIRQKIQETQNRYKNAHPESTALIVNIQGEADGWFKFQFPRAVTRRIASSGSGAARRQGQSDGHGVSMGSSGHVGTKTLMLS